MHVIHVPADAATELMSAAASVPCGNAAVLSNQLRTSGGYTHAGGCLNPDTGRLVWAKMQAVMGGGGAPRRVRAQRKSSTPPAAPSPDDYALPEDLEGTSVGRLYRVLLAAADTDGVRPTLGELEERSDVRTQNVPYLLKLLCEKGHIRFVGERAGARQRDIEIVATCQKLRCRQGRA